MKRLVFPVFLVVVIGVFFVVGGVFGGIFFPPKIEQPIRFDHKLHVVKTNGAGMKCINCHKFYLTQRNSGRPSIEVCKACHDNPGKDPDKAKLMKFLDKDQEIPWKRIYYLRDYVRYPHLFHTDKIDCVVCHGPMADQTSPPGARMVKQNMSFCIDCHKSRGATTECTSCHK